MDKKSKTFLYNYLNNASPTGFEHKGQQLWLDYIKPYTNDYMVDVYGTAVGIVNPKAPYKVVIEAHADEISWFVNYISDEGYIYVRRNGGSDHQIALPCGLTSTPKKRLSKVSLAGRPYMCAMRPRRRPQPSKNIFIDIGAESKKEVEAMGVHVGCVITFVDELMELNKNYLVGRALDNRWGDS